MIEHEPLREAPKEFTPQPQASDVRVTAEEFAAAIDALEQRKAEEANRLAGTVAIGETISELRIDATPEDILKEIELQRARKDAEALRVKAAADARAKLAADALNAVKQKAKDVLGPQVGPVQSGLPNQQAPQGYRAARQAWRDQRKAGRSGGWFGPTVGVIAMTWFMFSLMSGHLIHGFPFAVHHGSPGHAIELKQVADAQTVYCGNAELKQIIESGGTINASDSTVSVTTGQSDNSWPLILHQGKLYLEGFTRIKDMSQLQDGPQQIFNDNNSGDLEGEHVSDVIVPVPGTHLGGYSQYDDYSRITLENVQIDNFTQDSKS